jgi:hypothetical protein
MKQLVKLWERPSSDGKEFRYYLLFTDNEGKRRQKSLGHSDRRWAERQRAQFERELQVGIVETGSMRLSKFTEDMRKSELLNLTWADIDFESRVVEVSPKEDTPETWEWRIKDTDRRTLSLKEDVIRLLINLQDQRPEGYPYVLVPPRRYDYIQNHLRATGEWTLSHARTSVINNFKVMFDRILAAAHVKNGTFHDLRRTAITEWLYQGLNIFDVMRLAGHSKYETTYQFYLQVKDGLMDRARGATRHCVSPELLQKCCSRVSGERKSKGCRT